MGDTVAGLHRRRKASQRSALLDCGCADPWCCRCRRPPLSDRMIDAGAAAATHLLDTGYLPIFDLPTLRELWRGGHHQLVDELRGGDR